MLRQKEFENMEKIQADKMVKNTGNSLIVYVTKELRALELDDGDMVRVTLEKIN